MATAAASFLGYAYYNNGWVPVTNSESSYYTTASQYGMAICGKNSYWRYGVFKISIPTLTGPTSSRHIYFNTSLCTQTTGDVSFHVVIAKVGRADSSSGGGKEATYPSNANIIKDVQVTCNMSSSGYNRVSFDFDCSEIAGGTYYIWLWGNSLVYFRYNANDSAQTFVCSVTYTPYTACSAPTSLSLSKTLVVPGGSATLSWSGASTGVSTTISGYSIYYSDGGSSWTYLKTVSTQSTSGSTTVNGSNSRGILRYFKIITVCAQGSSYNSGYSGTSSFLKTNTLPVFTTQPVLSTAYLPSSGGKITLTWKANDADSSSLQALIWQSDYDELMMDASIGTYTFSTTKTGEIQISLFDGLESSATVTLSFTVNTKPVINSITVTPNSVSGNSSTTLATQISASASTSKKNLAYNWFIYTNSSSTLLSRASAISNMAIFNHVTRGNTFKIGLQVNDGYDSSQTVWSQDFRCPYKLGAPIIQGVYNGGTESSPLTVTGTQKGQYGSEYFVSIQNPTVGDGYPNISSIEIITNNGSKRVTTLTSAGKSTTKINGSTVSPGNTDSILVRVTSTTGETSSAQSSIKRAVIPSLTGTLSMTGPEEDGKIGIRPFTNTSTVSFSTSTGNKDSCENGFNWTVACYYNNKAPYVIGPSGLSTSPTISGSTITFTLTSAEVKSKFLNSYFESSSGIYNLDYDVTFLVYAADNFGQSSNVLYFSGARLLYVEAPIMNASTATLGINYVPGTSSYINTLTTSSANQARMINNEENVYLTVTPATDYNKDLSGYFVNVAELDSAPTGSYSQYFTTPATHSITRVYPTVASSNNLDVLQYTLGNYNTHKFLVFQIWAIDGGGRTSKNCAYSSTYLIACRKTAPQLKISSATYREVSTSSRFLDLQLEISDFGDSYNEGKVLANDYIKNFEREITSNGIAYSLKKKMFIEVTASLQDTFPNDSTKTTVTSLARTTDFHGYNGVVSVPIESDFVGKRIYLKARLSITTGYGAQPLDDKTGISYVTNISSPYVYFTVMPTISYRAHCIGINTNSFSDDEDEVLKVSDTETRGKIRLIGTDTVDGITQDNEILINLKKGTITGDNIYAAKVIRWTL